jgi:hypothetical protein
MAPRGGQEAGHPVLGAALPERAQLDGGFGVARGVLVGGVEPVHEQAPGMDDAVDVLQEAHEASVVPEEDWGVRVDQRPERGDGLQSLRVGDRQGADHGIREDAEPGDRGAGLALVGGGHLEADCLGEVRPVAKQDQGAVDPQGEKVGVVGVAAGGDEAVLAGAQGGALGVKCLVGRVGVGGAKGGLLLVEAAAEEPEDGLGEALGHVGAWAEAEA